MPALAHIPLGPQTQFKGGITGCFLDVLDTLMSVKSAIWASTEILITT